MNIFNKKSSVEHKDSSPLEPREQKKRRRERFAILFLVLLFIILMLIEFRISRVSSSLPFVNSIFFFGLININILILITIVWLVFRNIGKLFIERRRKVLGSRLKTKLVISFLAFSITPTIVLFIISATYINTNFDKWFSLKIQNTLQTSLDITQLYYEGTQNNVSHFAEHLSKELVKRISKETSKSLASYLESQRTLLALDSVEFYREPLSERLWTQKPDLITQSPQSIISRLPLDILNQVYSGQSRTLIQNMGEGDLIRAAVPVRYGPASAIQGVLVVSRYLPITLADKVDEISDAMGQYKVINPLKYPVKTAYLLILIMITLVIIFVAIWIGLYMAKELTDPIGKLVLGAQAIGRGNLDVEIKKSGHDEIAVLVESFNKMASDLREGRKDLERRKLQLEAILANVGTGVISLDPVGLVTTINRAACELLSLTPDQVVGFPYQKSFHEVLHSVFDQALYPKTASLSQPQVNQVSYPRVNLKAPLTLAAIATPLPSGAVVVLDDLSFLIKSQREMAWREVARRVAHEIKNPLTPIKLSAQRLQRQLSSLVGREGELLKDCTETIVRHTDELKELVNEFYQFARVPESHPSPNSLIEVIKEVSTLYEQAHSTLIQVISSDPRLPIFSFDRDQMKRVFINLYENSIAAMKEVSSPRIEITLTVNENLKRVEIKFEDNGQGMSEEVQSRVFEPYFSTKSEGSGLGMAIVKRMISDHNGYIKVISQEKKGTQFVIELPL